jgi:hypothetical protein
MLRILLLCHALFAFQAISATDAGARIIERTLLPLSIRAGGHCDRPPDDVLPAPGTQTGEIDHNFRGFDFVTDGDILPPAIGLGFGLSVKLPGYGPGHRMAIRISAPDGHISTWQIPVPETGILEVGRLPMPGQSLPEGRYVLTILDGETLLIAYDFLIVGADTEGLCTPMVS